MQVWKLTKTATIDKVRDINATEAMIMALISAAPSACTPTVRYYKTKVTGWSIKRNKQTCQA